MAKRESARFARDFDSADKLREQLSKLGVTLDDQNKRWHAADGRSGPITAVNISELHAQKAAKSGAAPLSDDEIDRLVREREQARFTSDYKTADRLRDTLEKHGVSLELAHEIDWSDVWRGPTPGWTTANCARSATTLRHSSKPSSVLFLG